MYHKDIMKHLTSELTEHDSILKRNSSVNAVINPKPANEVICTRTPSMLYVVMQIQYSKFGSSLEQDIHHYTSGDHQKECAKEDLDIKDNDDVPGKSNEIEDKRELRKHLNS